MEPIPRQRAKVNIVPSYSGEVVRKGARHVDNHEEEVLGWTRW